MKLIFSAVLVLFVCSGCVSKIVHAPTKNYSVKIESDPPGMRVFVSLGATERKAARNRTYVGQTPCVAQVRGDLFRNFKLPEQAFVSGYSPGVAIFICEPPSGSTNLFPQSARFGGKSNYSSGDKIPEALFFDMMKR